MEHLLASRNKLFFNFCKLFSVIFLVRDLANIFALFFQLPSICFHLCLERRHDTCMGQGHRGPWPGGVGRWGVCCSLFKIPCLHLSSSFVSSSSSSCLCTCPLHPPIFIYVCVDLPCILPVSIYLCAYLILLSSPSISPPSSLVASYKRK